jgi:GlpG protein
MAETSVLVVDLDVDLQSFSRLLWQRGIPHRIHESAGRQVLAVAAPDVAATVRDLYAAFLDGAVAPGRVRAVVARPAGEHWQVWLVRAPLTLALVLGCLLGYLVVASGDGHWLSALTFQSYFELGGARFNQGLVEALGSGQLWRLWSPIFLHFGLLHLVFNALWLWEFGRRIEYLQGTGRLALLVVLIGLGSNLTQYHFASNAIFGGMSGVVYGLVGYCLGWSTVRPGEDFGVPRALSYMMVGLMLLALTGIFTLFGFGAVANAAHLSGFAIGLLLGLALASLRGPGIEP